MKKIKVDKQKLILTDEIEKILEDQVKKIGTGGMVLVPKRFIGRKVYVLIQK
jgi:putative transposon-encoded protein